MRGRSERGATTLEMAMVGIPLIFMLISVFEISRGMWMYHTAAYAVKNGVRFAIVHGIDCVNTADNPNKCPTTISAVATLIQQSGVGLDPAITLLTFTPGTTTATPTSCYLRSGGSAPYGSFSACSTYTTTWPPDSAGVYNGFGKPIRIDIKTPFFTALTMFAPGSKPVSFALVNMAATSLDYIQF
jgi:hypothetical protein